MKNEAIAYVFGGPLAPQISGTVRFIPSEEGTCVKTYIKGLPEFKRDPENNILIGPHGFHVHNIGSCAIGERENPFQAAGEHYDPDKQPHGNHAGDFPVLFSMNGTAKMDFYTNRFTVDDVIGKSVVIHEGPDDYRTEPAGDSGKRIACGVIMKVIESARSYL